MTLSIAGDGKKRLKDCKKRTISLNLLGEYVQRLAKAHVQSPSMIQLFRLKISNARSLIKASRMDGLHQEFPSSRSGKKIAIVGSGPAGLASADQLNQAGHAVTVFERSDRLGGLLTYGIPNMKLDKEVVERRVKLLRQEGIDFVTNTEIGVDITADELKSNLMRSSFVQVHKSSDLLIEGREAKGIHLAMDYLTLATKSMLDSGFKDKNFIDAKGKDVIVIGGGDTGADCVATALRQKAKSVVQFGKYPKLPDTRVGDNMWPEQPYVFSLDYAYEEAQAKFGEDPRQYSIQTTKIVADKNGKLKSFIPFQMEKVKNEHGKFEFHEIPGTEKVWPAQLVFIAIGFEGTEQPLVKHFGVDSKNNRIDAKYGEYTTNVEGVFAAGDARRGQSLIVWAINEGRQVAHEVDRYLMGSSVLPK